MPPPRGEEHCWSGAPSVLSVDEGIVWLTYRLRTPEERGYELGLARSSDGRRFETVLAVTSRELGVRSLERACLRRRPGDGLFELYLCYDAGRWEIAALEAVPRPDALRLRDPRPLTNLLDTAEVTGIKDPYIVEAWGSRWMLYTAYWRTFERLFIARQEESGQWQSLPGNPLLPNQGWHRMYTRASWAWLSGPRLFLYYDGCTGTEYWPIYNIRLGVALTEDLQTVLDLTPDQPLLQSPTPGRYSTLRYLDRADLPGASLFYYEAARPDEAFELRVSPATTASVALE